MTKYTQYSIVNKSINQEKVMLLFWKLMVTKWEKKFMHLITHKQGCLGLNQF